MSSHKPGRGRPRVMVNEQVVDVAMNAYWQTNPSEVSVNEICKLAGISKPSLYREFGNEDGLTRATLDRYAEKVLTKLFTLLQEGGGLQNTLNALIEFASANTQMETGCLFYKMRVSRHRLGPLTRLRVEEIEAEAQAAYIAFLQAHYTSDDWPTGLSVETGAKYLSEQLALAITQRAAGESQERIREMLRLALSVFVR